MKIFRALGVLLVIGAPAAANAGYSIDWSTRTGTGALQATGSPSSCQSRYANGVVRSWYLKEKNKYDFRRSYHYCRNMGADGKLESSYERNDHFQHDGSGTKGNSSIPTDKLPVGVRIKYKVVATGISSYQAKISDVNMLYNTASKIVSNDSGYSAAGYALGRSGSTKTVYCGDGYVMTGLYVEEKAGAGGNNQSEIWGVSLECAKLKKS